MTSPIVDIEVECPDCGEQFVAWHRASVNLSLGEQWTEEELDEAKFAILIASFIAAVAGFIILSISSKENPELEEN